MSFFEQLEVMCAEVPGSRTAMVMGLDGIAVATHQATNDDIDTESMLIELIGTMKQATSALKAVDAGDLSTLELTTKKGTLLVGILNEEHFVAMYLAPEALVGKGRYAMRRHRLALRKELI